ncbi:uncharacterized protein LOC132635886 isoform X1 [Lycium barbarum]|uniref:uncharacterized protein LOC132635886 isoform X1 n=1 Tax=Lycium barbarum TaxID=112863 RepID=UPI00293F08B5|nr:uncharacterized protein LOC132635886 isoform X1 [Lycium barbarum]
MCLAANGFEPMLKESINHFLTSYRNGSSDFSVFESIFFRLIQTMPDPPLEITWFYSAVTFHTSKKSAVFSNTIVAKDLFQLLISCSCSCNGTKKIALLAPLVYVLYDVVCEFKRNGVCLNSEIRDLVEKVSDYVCVCLGDRINGNGVDEDIVCFEELVGVWMVDRVGKCAKFEENLGIFFPIGSVVEVSKGRNTRCGIRDLAGIVMCEVFLLNLSLKFNSVRFVNEEFQNDARNWAIQTLKQFQNIEFLDLLLRILLEKGLVVTALLSAEDAVVLQKLLYDAVITVDHSFLSSGSWFQLPESYFRNLALLWSLVADNAIQFAREICDQDRLIAYVNAFSESQLPSELLKWVSIQAGTEENLSNPKLTTPKALIKSLFVLEDQGLWVFDHDRLKFHAKAAICNSRPDCFLPEVQPEVKCFGDEEMGDSLDKTFSANYFCADKLPIDGGRKRKDRVKDTDIRGTAVKLVKYNVHESPNREKFLPFSDEDMEVMG